MIQTIRIMSLGILLVLTFGIEFVTSFEQYLQLIPNGPNVPNPCQRDTTWPGVGHQAVLGGGTNNAFGNDFAANGNVWNVTLCQKDSDGDGRSNGLELGDPNCTWTAGNPPPLSSGLTHPGVCEPLSSKTCLGLNTWLNCAQFTCPAFSLPTTQNITLAFPPTPVPAQQTTYICLGFNLPNETNYQIIGMRPLLNNTNVIHHMLLYGCTSASAQESFLAPAACDMGLPGCSTILGLWSAGVQGQCNSDQFGFPMGPNGIQYAVLQLHWNNPSSTSGQTDSSGMLIYYTSVLRPNDGQIWIIGQENLPIPPGLQAVPFNGSCTSACTQLMPNSVNISVALLHMHLIGHTGNITVTHNGVSSAILNVDHYDFNTPTLTTYDIPLAFYVGDQMAVNCVYNSLSRTSVTNYGPSTSDEMCYGFITVYPAIVGFDVCSEWKDVMQCPLSSDVTYASCQFKVFEDLLDASALVCNASCSQECRQIINDIMGTGCLQGNLGQYINNFWPRGIPGLAWLFNIIEKTCAPAPSTTGSTRNSAGSSFLKISDETNHIRMVLLLFFGIVINNY